MAPCDPSKLWVGHKIRWCDSGKKGSGWYKLKETGRATFFVKLVAKQCPLCGLRLNHNAHEPVRIAELIDAHHPRPAEWLAKDNKTRDYVFKADEVVTMLMADAHAASKED